MKRVRMYFALVCCFGLCCLEVQAGEEVDTQVQVARMLLNRARDEYEIVAKAKAANRGLIERLEQQLQPYLERREGELVYNFRRAQSGSTPPSLNEIQELADWHEKAVKRHFYYTDEGIKTGVKLNDALNRMEELGPAEDDHQLEAE